MINTICKAVSKYHLENGVSDDTNELLVELRANYVDEAINDLINNSRFIVINSKFFIKIGRGKFTNFAELLGSSKRLQWHPSWIYDVTFEADYSQREMIEIITDLIIRNDLLTTT